MPSSTLLRYGVEAVLLVPALIIVVRRRRTRRVRLAVTGLAVQIIGELAHLGWLAAWAEFRTAHPDAYHQVKPVMTVALAGATALGTVLVAMASVSLLRARFGGARSHEVAS